MREQITVEALTTDTALADTLTYAPVTSMPVTALQVTAAHIAIARLSPHNFTLGGAGNKTITWLGTRIALLLTDTLWIDYYTEDPV